MVEKHRIKKTQTNTSPKTQSASPFLPPNPQPESKISDGFVRNGGRATWGKTWFFASHCPLPVSHKQTGRAKGSTDFGAHVQTAMASSPPLQMSSYIGFLTKAFSTRITPCPQPGSQALLGLGHCHLFGRDRFHSESFKSSQ